MKKSDKIVGKAEKRATVPKRIRERAEIKDVEKPYRAPSSPKSRPKGGNVISTKTNSFKKVKKEPKSKGY